MYNPATDIYALTVTFYDMADGTIKSEITPYTKIITTNTFLWNLNQLIY